MDGSPKKTVQIDKREEIRRIKMSMSCRSTAIVVKDAIKVGYDLVCDWFRCVSRCCCFLFRDVFFLMCDRCSI